MMDDAGATRAHDARSPLVETHDAVPPSVGDLLRYLWGRRVRLLVLFLLLSGLGGIGLLGWWLFGSRSAHGVIALGFQGIERHEYPSGKSFAIEDIRSPKVLARALESVGLAAGSYDLQEIYRGIDMVPIVPSSVVERWKKQDRDGARREDFLPSEFALDVRPGGLDDTERVQLLYALLAAYQEQVKYEQQAELQRVATATMPGAQLTTLYDYWDIPLLLRAQADNLRARLAVLIRESHNFRDPTVNLSFLEVDRELDTWRDTRLEALSAVVHRERLVKDPDSMLRRLEERQSNLEIELQKINGHLEATTKLLQVIEQPRSFLTSQTSQREGAPLVDMSTLDKILKSDYVGPVVVRARELHEEAAKAAAARERVQREITLLKTAEAGAGKPPVGFEELVVLVAGDLDRIVKHYVQVLDGYLEASVTRYVTLREGPYLKLAGPRMAVVAAAIVFTAAILALLIVIVSDSLRRGSRAD